jgi:hypothetical protein
MSDLDLSFSRYFAPVLVRWLYGAMLAILFVSGGSALVVGRCGCRSYPEMRRGLAREAASALHVGRRKDRRRRPRPGVDLQEGCSARSAACGYWRDALRSRRVRGSRASGPGPIGTGHRAVSDIGESRPSRAPRWRPLSAERRRRGPLTRRGMERPSPDRG